MWCGRVAIAPVGRSESGNGAVCRGRESDAKRAEQRSGETGQRERSRQRIGVGEAGDSQKKG